MYVMSLIVTYKFMEQKKAYMCVEWIKSSLNLIFPLEGARTCYAIPCEYSSRSIDFSKQKKINERWNINPESTEPSYKLS